MSAAKPQQRNDRFADYVSVAERIEAFYSRFPEGRIITGIVEHDVERGFILMRAEVFRQTDDAMPSATGHAFEIKSEGYVQKTSYIEVCETSSVGRALAMLGFEVKRGIASREEMGATQDRPRADSTSNETPSSPVAKTIHDLVTPKQLVAIRAIANVVAVNAEEECAKQYECKPEELSRRGASAFIDHLKTLGTDAPQSSNVSPIRRPVDTDETPQQRFERVTREWSAPDRNALIRAHKGNYANAADEAEES